MKEHADPELEPLAGPVPPQTTVIGSILRSLNSLYHSPRDLWILYTIELFSMTSMELIIICMKTYLEDSIGLTENQVALIITFFIFMSAIICIVFGNCIDRFGVKNTIKVSLFIGIFGFVLLCAVTNKYAVQTIILLFHAPSSALLLGCFKVGIKHYTLEAARSLGYSLFYMVLITSSIIAKVLKDWICNPLDNEDILTFRYIFGVAICFLLVAWFLPYFLRELDFQVSGTTEIVKDDDHGNMWKFVRSVLILSSFWRLVRFALLVSFMKAAYSHVYVTMPLYLNVTIEFDAHIEYAFIVHKMTVLIAIIPLTFLVNFISNFNLVLIGSSITTLSFAPIIMYEDPTYFRVCLFVFFLSIGEAIVAPRFIEYAIQIAPKGKEATFFLIATVPMIIYVIIAGGESGRAIKEYCNPANIFNGQGNDCRLVWLIIFTITLVSAILLLSLVKYLRQPEIETQKYISMSKEAKDHQSSQ
ncbi:unnamed protein product [Blepharisma stoltei]|uniref:Uncharacterized protein n=1 Tax=Blepharisma stoltei TaxID=1481888 RepID=A0AAU9IPA0_9CILI|nr:unnamed protein product [Blepharisma stoltei]